MSIKQRLYHTLRLCLIRSATKRAEYAKINNVYASVGENCMIMPRKVPLYPELIKLHNNVRIASNVTFITHDDIHRMLNNMYPEKEFPEKIGCIEIQDNVFVGADTKIMYNVRIGSNVIIASGSIVTKDIPSNTVVAGIPAKPIGTFDEYVEKKMSEKEQYPRSLRPRNQHIEKDLINIMWEKFERQRKQK